MLALGRNQKSLLRCTRHCHFLLTQVPRESPGFSAPAHPSRKTGLSPRVTLSLVCSGVLEQPARDRSRADRRLFGLRTGRHLLVSGPAVAESGHVAPGGQERAWLLLGRPSILGVGGEGLLRNSVPRHPDVFLETWQRGPGAFCFHLGAQLQSRGFHRPASNAPWARGNILAFVTTCRIGHRLAL